MKRFIYTVCLVIICLFTLNLTAKHDDVTLLTGIHENGKLYDFWEISELYETIPHPQKIEKSVDEIAKFAYSRYKPGYHISNSIVIDLQKQTLFTEAEGIENLRRSQADYKMTDEELQYVKSLIESYDVLSWGSDAKKNIWGEYENKSGYWELMLQFNDGTVVLLGNTTHKEGHGEFVDELYDFIGSRERNLMKDFLDIWYQSKLYENPESVVQTADTITKIIYWDNIENKGLNSDFIVNVKDKLLFTYDETWYFTQSDDADYLMTDEEAQQIKDIAEKYDIVSWEVPPYKPKEGESELTKYMWELVIQFEDHSLKTLFGTDRTMVEGQTEFTEELREFENSKTPNR